MKTILLASIAICLAQFALAQDRIESLSSGRSAKGGPAHFGAYGAVRGQLSSFNGDLAVYTGGYGGVFLNKKFLLGAGHYNLTNNIRPAGFSNRKWELWYTGFVFEYVHNSDKLFHWSVGTLVGGGRLSEREYTDLGNDKERKFTHSRSRAFVAEPFINAELNVTPWLRVVAGGAYRQVFGLENVALSNQKVSAPSFHLGVKAGLF